MQIMKRQQARRSPAVAGFTTVEIMVVIAIVGMLATLVVTNVMDHSNTDFLIRTIGRGDLKVPKQSVRVA